MTRKGKVRATEPAKLVVKFPDLVTRNVTASRPNQFWVADIMFVPKLAGITYVAFMTDADSRKILGWNTSSRLTPQSLPQQALEASP